MGISDWAYTTLSTPQGEQLQDFVGDMILSFLGAPSLSIGALWGVNEIRVIGMNWGIGAV
jgi:hypothetical protein